MAMKEEILKRLSIPDQDFHANLSYGIKLWKSGSFYYMSKYEVIFEHFLDGLGGYAKQLSKQDPAGFDGRWALVNEFLALPCPSNALPSRVIPRLGEVFDKLRKGKSIVKTRVLLESFLTVAFDVKYKNFYKFDYLSYGTILGTALRYYLSFLEDGFQKDEEEDTIKRIFDDIRIYVKSAGGEEKWQKAFTTVLPSLCEVVLQLKSRGLDCQESLLDLLKQIYFLDGKGPQYNRVTDASKKHLFMSCFDANDLPLHVIALLIEGYLKAYREVKLDILLFLKYFLLHVFVDAEKSILSDMHQIFQLTKFVFHLLKKYFIKIDQKLVEDFDFTGIFTVKLKDFLDKYSSSETHLADIFALICTINQYNPLILEASIIDIILRAMFTKKGPQALGRYQAMLISTIDLFGKLNRSENFREELFLKLGDYLDDHELGDTLKELRKGSRKRKSLAAGETPGKRRKLENGEDSQDPDDSEHYLNLLYPSESEASVQKSTQLQLQDHFKSLSFAWPDSDGALGHAMLDYVRGLLTKRSFIYWRKMQDYLAEQLETVTEDPSEAELFKLDFAVCWLCYFFAGNTLVEQTNLFWEKLQKQFGEFDELMASFGRVLIGGSVTESRVFASFLKLVYFYGNYRLVVHHYRPDSIEDSQSHLIHEFLTQEEWNQLEQKVPTSEEPLYNRVRLQKLRQTQLTTEEPPNLDCVDKILASQDFNQLRWLLADRSTNGWFLQQLEAPQKTTVIEQLLQNGCFPEIKQIVTQQCNDHALMEVTLLTTYKRLVESVLGDCKASVARKFSFEGIHEGGSEDETMARVQKLLEKKVKQGDEQQGVELDVEKGELRELLGVLDFIRIDEMAVERKTVIVGVGVLIFADLFKSEQQEIVAAFKNVISKQLIYGTTPNLLKFLDFETLIAIFGQSSPLTIALFRQTAVDLSEEAFAAFQQILDNFKSQQSQEARLELVLLVFNCLQKNSANRRKLIPVEQLGELISGYVEAIEAFIVEKEPKTVKKEDKAAFESLLKGCSLIIRYKAVKKQELGDKLRGKFLRCAEQALKLESSAASGLLVNALQHKDYLRLEADRVESIVENRWNGFLAQLRSEVELNEEAVDKAGDDSDVDGHFQSQNAKIFANFLTHHESPGKLTKRFDRLETEAATGTDFKTLRYIMRVYTTLAKFAFGTGVALEVEKAFVRAFGAVLAKSVMAMSILKKHVAEPECLEEVLNCFVAMVANPKLTLIPSIMDNIVEFLSSINIRKFTVKDGEEKPFYRLHRLISDVLYLLMTTRPNYVDNRLPHYFNVYNGLMAAVIQYKEDRPAEQPLNSFEILTLSDLLLPLEKIMSLAEKKVEKDLRIIAPYILAQIIGSITEAKRATTLHEKIARNVHNICYGLVAIYDKHSAAYLLRTCDEAAKNVYTDIVKGFRKYRSFKGKV
ncbi:hypothetical protein quinque_006041 [Culex quinquefasciatus]